MPITHHQAEVNGVRLHYTEAGNGPLIVCLHGFPEFCTRGGISWKRSAPPGSASSRRTCVGITNRANRLGGMITA
jgi:pimeloyl-ACP methyl ester carboxylesterase